jgi:hypothetical protein
MRLIILRITLALTAGALIVPQSHDRATAFAVAAATKYVEHYMQEFSAIVCEEQQVQTMVRPNRSVAKTRRLVSDLAFIKIREGSWRHQVYRDVKSVDGKPVRGREDRLKKLFLEGSKTGIEQARAIAAESNRYNLGVNRVGVSPLLPLQVLYADRVSQFEFSLSGRTLTFDERLSPGDPGFTESGRRGNLIQHGSFVVVDPETGAIETATLMGSTVDGRPGSSFAVRYVRDSNLKLLVPSAMEERYLNPDRPKDDHLEATSTFSSYRRFQVIVEERIK